MKKDYIPLQNGDGELEAYFLKAKLEEPNKGLPPIPIDDAYGLSPVVEHDEQPIDIPFHHLDEQHEFCCPVGEKGEIGEQGIPPLDAPTTEEKEAFFKKVMGKLKGWTQPPAKTAQIDDSLDEDAVDDLVSGRVYKIKGLNIIARYKTTLETGHVVMSFHGHRFLVVKEDNMVLKAGTNEVEKYLNKIL